MPIYEYKCSSCGHKKEVLQKMSEAPLTECPACGKPALTKLISAAGFQLKGSGWYATDFKGSKSAKPGKDDGSSDGKSAVEGKAGGAQADGGSKAKDNDKSGEAGKPKEESKSKEESKPKEEAKSEKPASAGASPAGQ
jgi:putative FmdB family regulatory protein